MTKRSWYNINSRPSEEPRRGSGKRHAVPLAVIRNMNLAPTGPGAVCEHCHTRFRLEFMNIVVVGFSERWLCKECTDQLNLKDRVIK